MKNFNPRVFVLAIPIAIFGLMIVSMHNQAVETEAKLIKVISEYGLNDQERNLVGYMKVANAHHFYDIAEQIRWCLDNKVPMSHYCVMDNGVTVKDELEGRTGMGY